MTDRESPMVVSVIPGDAFSWASQAAQYRQYGTPGIQLESHHLDLLLHDEVPWPEPGKTTTINCLLHRDEHGALDGILNHYDGANPLESKDAINVWVHPHRQRQGIATALVREAMRRWPGVTYQNQRYTPQGLFLLQKLLKEDAHGGHDGSKIT